MLFRSFQEGGAVDNDDDDTPVEEGNIDLNNRPTVKNSDGSISTVRSMSVGTDRGEVLIPTVHPQGYVMSDDDDAIKHWQKTGQHLGIYKSPAAATRAGKRISAGQAKRYGGRD